MKKVLFTFALLLACQFSFGQSFDDFVNTFKKETGVLYMPINKSMIDMMSQSISAQGGEEAEKAAELFSKLDNMEALVCESGDDALKDKMFSEATAMMEKSYEKGLESNEGDTFTKVNFKKEGDKISEIVVVVREKSSENMIIVTRMQGKFDESDLQKALENKMM